MDVTKKQKALLRKLKTQMRKIAQDLECKLKEGFVAKKRTFALALAKLERKHAAQLTKSVTGKGRKVAKKRRIKRK